MGMIKKRLTALVMGFALAGAVAVAAPPGPGRQNNDIATMKQIRKKLVTLPFYGVFDNLAYSMEGGTVTLYGQVVRPSTRKDAERRVEKIEGVERVINDIEVLPLSPFDDRIRVRAFRAISRAGSLFRYFQGANPSIHIVVNRGHLTLEGVVSNRADSRLANIAARQVPDAFSVTNNLRVERED
ncbi:MAG TPA: BON domain-containing protein [Blastocatellia bacterium]|jgi:hyperosmotically inducible protein|nr:BON domain-containing protein [Blastocatellia bacterium]